jgi:hypothetical protein
VIAIFCGCSSHAVGGGQVVPVVLQQIRYAAAEGFGLEILVATECRRMQAAIIAGGAQRIARVVRVRNIVSVSRRGCRRQRDDSVTSIALSRGRTISRTSKGYRE